MYEHTAKYEIGMYAYLCKIVSVSIVRSIRQYRGIFKRHRALIIKSLK